VVKLSVFPEALFVGMFLTGTTSTIEGQFDWVGTKEIKVAAHYFSPEPKLTILVELDTKEDLDLPLPSNLWVGVFYGDAPKCISFARFEQTDKTTLLRVDVNMSQLQFVQVEHSDKPRFFLFQLDTDGLLGFEDS
jgi:hypothetical protein